MTLIQHSPALSPEDLATSIVINSDTTRYIIFYASVDPSTGKSWCGDCRDAEPLIEAKFKEDGKDVIVVAVGERLM
jgi:thiol-disulfide isomerase/thioredoxin